MTDLLHQGIAAAKAGRKSEARTLLTQVVEADTRSEQGWLWLAGVVEDPEAMRACLHKVLEINPDNPRAKQGLAWVDQRYGPPAPARLSAVQPVAEPPARIDPAPNAPLERALGSAFTRTTTSLIPVPDPLVAEPPRAPTPPRPAAPAARRAPVAPTQRFRGGVPPMPPTPPERAAAPQAAPTAAPAPPHSAPVVQPPARPTPAPTTIYAPVVPASLATPAENPCPYCGAPTTLAQQRCTQCRGDLMVRAAPPAQRSFALTLLGLLWRVGGVLLLGLALLRLVVFLTIERGGVSSSAVLLVVAVNALLGLVYIAIARGLLARDRWSYFVNIALIAISLLITIGVLILGATLLGAVVASLGRSPLTERATLIAGIVTLLLAIAFVLAPIVLTILSYRDFFGPMVRFRPQLEETDHIGHYNTGIGYRNRGMWYMAAQEWEIAARKKPREANYLHALGLAYAQLKRFDQARAALDSALRAEPENPKIKESRALIDQMAQQMAK